MKRGSSWLVLCLVIGIIWMGPDLQQLVWPGSRSEGNRSGTSADWNEEQLVNLLSRYRPEEVQFEETIYSDLLTQPLKTRGTLRFLPPSQLEKHVTDPYDERYVIEGDRVLFENKNRRIMKRVSLEDYPALRAFVEAFRSSLAGDVNTLRRYYRVKLEGDHQRWTLTLHPIDQAVQELAETIHLSGEGNQLTKIVIRRPDGDRSVMVLTQGAP